MRDISISAESIVYIGSFALIFAVPLQLLITSIVAAFLSLSPFKIPHFLTSWLYMTHLKLRKLENKQVLYLLLLREGVKKRSS